MANRNVDKHQIAHISNKNCLYFSHFVAPATVVRETEPSDTELNKTLHEVGSRDEVIAAFSCGMISARVNV